MGRTSNTGLCLSSCASNIQISEAEKAELIKEWGSSMRILSFDEAPPPPLF